MEWLADIGGLLASGASGGVFGLLGGVFKFATGYLEKREARKWQREKWDREERLQRLEMERGDRETENELRIVSQKGSWEGMAISHKADAAMNKHTPRWAIAICKLYRPALTTFMIVLVYLIWTDLVSQTGIVASMDGAQVHELIRYMINSVVFTGMACVSWWVSERAVTPPGLKHR